jgi:methionyl-tRNA synthetase
VLYSAAEAIRMAAVLIAPTMPDTASEIERQLGLVSWERKWDQATLWGLLPEGLRIGEPSPLFPRLEATKAVAPETGEKPMEKQPERALVSIKEFQKIDLRVGEVLTAESVPGADKLLKLTVDIGGEVRTMVAGIALSYRPEELPGKRVVVVANLEPATIRGVRSEGMVLAGWVKSDDQSITLVSPERPLPKGSKVT